MGPLPAYSARLSVSWPSRRMRSKSSAEWYYCVIHHGGCQRMQKEKGERSQSLEEGKEGLRRSINAGEQRK